MHERIRTDQIRSTVKKNDTTTSWNWYEYDYRTPSTQPTTSL